MSQHYKEIGEKPEAGIVTTRSDLTKHNAAKNLKARLQSGKG